MEHPKFVTAPEIAEICNWPVAYRRRVARHIGLTDSEGNTCDYKEELSFWEDLLVYLEGGPAAYKTLRATKLQEKKSDEGRGISDRCFSNLVDLDSRVLDLDLEKNGDRGFVELVLWTACDLGLVKPAALFLWSFWLSTGSVIVNAIIDGDDRLIALFGNWRVPEPEPETVSAAVAEPQEAAALPDDAVELYTEPDEEELLLSGASVAAAVVPVVAPRQRLFDQLCAEVDEATEMPSPETALRAAKTTIEALLEDIERQARADAARAELEAALTALRQRSTPLDAGAAARRAMALDHLALDHLAVDHLAVDLSVLPAANVDALNGAAHDIQDRIRQADEARRDFERAAEQHGAERFNRDILRAYEEAIVRYDEAETALTQAVEKLAAVAASDTQGTPATGASDRDAGWNTP